MSATTTIPKIVLEDLPSVVPANIINEISCFVYYDKHPRDSKKIDITVCTKNKEVKEFYERALVSEFCLDDIGVPTSIHIMRNSECSLFYLVLAEDKITILSKENKIDFHCVVNNVQRYEINDWGCNGQALLKVLQRDSAVPITYDDNFIPANRAQVLATTKVKEDIITLRDLKKRSTEYKYAVKCNENTFNEFLSLRLQVAFNAYKLIHPNLTESVFKSDFKELAEALEIRTHRPYFRLCNKKIVIVLNIHNCTTECLENVHILLHVNSRPSLVYKTRLFQRLPLPPFWKERLIHTIGDREMAVTAIIDLKELKDNVTKSVEFGVVMAYVKSGRDYFLPFDNIVICPRDIMGVDFDAISTGFIEQIETNLAILATTENTNLVLRHIRRSDEHSLNMPETLASSLNMEQTAANVIIKKDSSYHPLDGVMCVFLNDATDAIIEIALHTRTPSQVLSFINFVYDAVPAKLIITTVNQTITSKTSLFSDWNEETSQGAQRYECSHYGFAMMNQANILMDHMDACSAKMMESEDPEVRSRLPRHIDLYAMGPSAFAALKADMSTVKRIGLVRHTNHSKDGWEPLPDFKGKWYPTYS